MEITESLKQAKSRYGNVIPKNIFDTFVSLDWTKTYKYVFKMCQLYESGYHFLNIISIFKSLRQYEKFMEPFDITNMDIESLKEEIEKAKHRKNTSRAQIKKEIKKDSIIYKSDNYIVYSILSFNIMQFHGKSTPWCIGLNEKEYDAYANMFDIFVIYNNDLRDTIYYKTAVFISDDVDMIVGMDNIHHYDTDKDYDNIVHYIYNDDIINKLGL